MLVGLLWMKASELENKHINLLLIPLYYHDENR